MPDIPTYTREELIAICEAAIVPEQEWSDRDSAHSHEKLGICWAMLRAGCDFHVLSSGNLRTDDRTIWLEIHWRGFNAFEWGDDCADHETFYLPTRKRLDEAAGKDWY